MDPLSVTASAIAILQISGAIINTCYDYRCRVKSAAKDASRIVNELNGLRAVIETLFGIINDDTENKGSKDSALQKLAGADGLLVTCKAELEVLEKKLEPKEGWRATRAAIFWPLKEADVTRALQNIDRTKSIVQLALAADQRKAALLSLDGIRSLTEQFSTSNLGNQRKNIFQWLSATNSASIHALARKKCQEMTGLWLLKGKPFEHWSAAPRSFLWIYGIPGCGKTIICSTIIDALSTVSQRSEKTALIYFYFDFNDKEKSKAEALVRSVIAQLLSQIEETPGVLENLYGQYQNGAFQPPLDDLFGVVPDILASFTKVYLIIDALDECDDLDEMLQILHDIRSWQPDHLRIIVTSRHLTDIGTSLAPITTNNICMHGSAVDNDIALYIVERLKNDPKLAKWPPQTQATISRTLNDRASGMFRWVVCQLDSLRTCHNIRDLKRALDALPKTLEETYERILLRIDERDRESALKILQWLCFAARPVTLQEAAEVLAVELDSSPGYDPELKPLDPQDVMLLCSTLVTRVDAVSLENDYEVWQTYDEYEFEHKDAQIIRLAHLSVKDYLLSSQIKTTKAAFFATDGRLSNLNIARTCLVYLLQPTFISTGYSDLSSLLVRLDKWPLYHYAAHFWPFHVKASGDDLDDTVWNLLHQFFESRYRESGGNFVAWATTLTPDISMKSAKLTHPLYYAASFGVTSLVRKLLESDPNMDVDTPGGRFDCSPLQVAGYRNHAAVVELLLQYKADPMTINCLGESCLFWAALRRHKAVQTLLEDHGATWTRRDDLLYRVEG